MKQKIMCNMKKVLCFAATLVLFYSMAAAQNQSPDEHIGFWSWSGYDVKTTTTAKTTTTTRTFVQYALFLRAEGQGMWNATKEGVSNLPITWSSDAYGVTITGNNLSLVLPFSIVEGEKYLVAPNGELMKFVPQSSKSEATATPVPTATPIPVLEDKYSVDGEACLILDRDNVRIYLMGTYEDDGPFDSILADIVVENYSENDINLWYDGMANGWTFGERSLLNNLICHAGSKTRAQLLLKKELIGVDTAQEIETLEILFRLRHDMQRSGKAYLGDVIFEQGTGVIHLHCAP